MWLLHASLPMPRCDHGQVFVLVFWLIHGSQPYLWPNVTWLIELILWQSSLTTVCMAKITGLARSLSRYSGDLHVDSGSSFPPCPHSLYTKAMAKKNKQKNKKPAPANCNQSIQIRKTYIWRCSCVSWPKCLYVKKEITRECTNSGHSTVVSSDFSSCQKQI